MGIYVFGLRLHWLPVQGWVMPTVDFWKSTRHAIIPVILLAIPSLAVTARQTRSSMLEVIRQDYIRTAWSKGLNEQLVVIRLRDYVFAARVVEVPVSHGELGSLCGWWGH